MDYYAIGQRIRKHRKAHRLSQEELADRIGISVTHMSHIETGNTKLSLPVLVDIANILGVHTDDLLFDAVPAERSAAMDAIVQTLNGCSAQQLRILEDILEAARLSLEQHL